MISKHNNGGTPNIKWLGIDEKIQMKSKYRHWSDPNIYVQMHNETNLAKTRSTEKKFFSI